MSDFNGIYNRVVKNEGGYNRAYGGSGETYKGIDRKYFPSWPGWPIIDAYKTKYGVPAEESYINDDTLESNVKAFYSGFLSPLNTSGITNQVLAEFVGDFLIHKHYDAIKVINAVAKGLGNPATSATSLTPDVVNLMNYNSSGFYNNLYGARIAYYTNPSQFGSSLSFSGPLQAAFIARVKRFPASLNILNTAWDALVTAF